MMLKYISNLAHLRKRLKTLVLMYVNIGKLQLRKNMVESSIIFE